MEANKNYEGKEEEGGRGGEGAGSGVQKITTRH